jgi:hypothetical protein
LNLLEEVLAEHQDTTSSGEDGGVLTNDISSSLLKREFCQIENRMSATMCRRKVLRSNALMLVKSVFQTTQCKQQTIILQDKKGYH